MTTAPIAAIEDGRGAERLLSRQFAILAASASCVFLGVGSLNVLLPQFVVDELGGSEATAGFAMGSMAITALLSRIWFGRMIDRRGARLIMVIGAALAVAATLLLTVTTTVAMLVGSRLVFGAGQAAFFTGATTLAIELAPPHRRSQAASYILIAVHVGMGIGPVIAVALSDRLSYRATWLVTAAVIGLGGLIARMMAYRRPDPHAGPSPLVHRNALAPGVVSLLGVYAFNGFLVFAPLYARQVDLVNVGLVFAVASLTTVLVRLTFGWVPDAIGPIRAGTGALVLTIAGAVTVALWAEPAGLFVGAVMLAGGLSLQSPSLIAVAVEGVPANERGSAMATFTAFFDIANAIVGPTIGLIVTGASYRAAFLTAAAMGVAGLVVLRLVVRPQWDRAHAARPHVEPVPGS